jgi:HIRAN domain
VTGTPRRRANDGVSLAVFLTPSQVSIEGPDGELVGLGFRAFLDRERTVELCEDDLAPVLPGVFFTRVDGVDFHDDVIPLRHFGAGSRIQIKAEPGNASDRDALAVIGGGFRVGFLPSAIAKALAPPGTRSGHGVVVTEWSTNGARHGVSILGSMAVRLDVCFDD